MAEKVNLLGKVVKSTANSIMGVSTEDATVQRATGTTVDWSAVVTYVGGTVLQMGVLILCLWGLQQVTSDLSRPLQRGIAIAFFTLVAIR